MMPGSLQIYDTGDPRGKEETVRKHFVAFDYLQYHFDEKYRDPTSPMSHSNIKKRPKSLDPLLIEGLKLFEALDLEQAEFVEIFRTASPNIGDERNMTVALLLCLVGSLDHIKLVEQEGARLNDVDIDNYNALHYCAMSNKADICSYIMAQNLTVSEAPATGVTLHRSRTSRGRRLPVHIAAMCGSLETLQVTR